MSYKTSFNHARLTTNQIWFTDWWSGIIYSILFFVGGNYVILRNLKIDNIITKDMAQSYWKYPTYHRTAATFALSVRKVSIHPNYVVARVIK